MLLNRLLSYTQDMNITISYASFNKNTWVTRISNTSTNFQVSSAYELAVPIFRQPIGDGESRIFGGQPAEKGQFPHQVGLNIDGSFFCSGSLISKNWVLTAGHCVDNFMLWRVVLGALNIRDTNEPGRVTMTVLNVIRHENYSISDLANDIGLLNLPTDVEFTGNNWYSTLYL